ncbi:hypothetical protein KIN20_024630 [Parelaphostrongylus tenuis]|uniref:Uncharacterized protein n=1 Tax=Parelaphostrongylus tenuis TaxID=148309 RepID=A0AAD5QWE2_PARTN|nr:hypothetical protein KIN20_024630 [Parelaphostrongylus tenuis]
MSGSLGILIDYFPISTPSEIFVCSLPTVQSMPESLGWSGQTFVPPERCRRSFLTEKLKSKLPAIISKFNGQYCSLKALNTLAPTDLRFTRFGLLHTRPAQPLASVKGCYQAFGQGHLAVELIGSQPIGYFVWWLTLELKVSLLDTLM